ncbi:sensor histidine kinase [Abyssalbus ytuae]|uniref:Histidine kinase n=1 Tax=Abyssalbus ytuae TaxID=2926907 RepID=A0A9E6ZU94_9FLAO|nr:histidine kinase [Abyssalbus ytuae]UOB16831.1 histidine kinase [Abyssalbus ytuae]
MKITRNESKIIALTSLIIAISFNIYRLLIHYTGKSHLVRNPWNFNFPELVYQTSFQLLFCFCFGLLNLWLFSKYSFNKLSSTIIILCVNIVFFWLFLATGIYSQRVIFDNVINLKIFRGAYLIKFILSLVLMSILVKILFLYRQQKQKDKENELLKNAYYDAEIKNLKAQIEPHFLFNTLTNLSALIREQPAKAQEYVSHLSKVFRYSLSNKQPQLVSLSDEIDLLQSHIELLKVRFENALFVNIQLNNISYKVPHMSLQPLIENVVKHNEVSVEFPVYTDIYREDDYLIFKNTLKEKKNKEPSTGVGLLNLNERYKILTGKEIAVEKTVTHFIVKIPLI